MGIHKELFESLKRGVLQESLYLTGVLLANQEVELLFLTWIQIMAFLGEFSQLSFSKWIDTCKDITNVLSSSEEIHVETMFYITTKICILFQNSNQYISISKKNISALRTNVLDIFSDKVKLSEAGRLRFMSILPKPLNEHEFCTKILGGLLSLWTKKEPLRLREALEYLCRKDYLLDSLVSETENNVASFLWDFLKIYQREVAQWVYPLYVYQYKKKDKSWRFGFLYAFHNLLYETLAPVWWSDSEKSILDYIHGLTEDLWMQVRESMMDERERDLVEGSGSGRDGGGGDGGEELDKMYYFENFFPRSKEERVSMVSFESSPGPSRSIHVKQKGRRGRCGESSKEKEDIYNSEYPYT